MEKVYELNEYFNQSFKDFRWGIYLKSPDIVQQRSEFLSAIHRLKDHLYYEKTLFDIHKVIELLENWHLACEFLISYHENELAIETFQLQYMLAAHIDQYSPTSNEFFDLLRKKMETLYEGPIPVVSDELWVRLIEAVHPLAFCPVPAAEVLKSRMYMIKAEILLRKKQQDKSLFWLIEAYFCLVDSVFQEKLDMDKMRLKLLSDIQECLGQKKKGHLASWVRKRMNIINNRSVVVISENNDRVQSLSKDLEGWPCAAFAITDSQEAHAHLKEYDVVHYYGDGNGRYHTFDDGTGRSLCRCKKCHGFFLSQHSEFHGEESDSYYSDYFPVSGATEALKLMQFDGWEIEQQFPGKYLVDTDGYISWYDLHLRGADATISE